MSTSPLARGRRWFPAVAVAAVILVGAVLRPSGVGRALGPLGVVGLDKYLHALAFGVLAVTIAVALRATSVERLVTTVVLVTVGYGLVVELVQLPLPYRSFSLLDVAADAVGAIVVALVWRTGQLLQQRRREPRAE